VARELEGGEWGGTDGQTKKVLLVKGRGKHRNIGEKDQVEHENISSGRRVSAPKKPKAGGGKKKVKGGLISNAERGVGDWETLRGTASLTRSYLRDYILGSP